LAVYVFLAIAIIKTNMTRVPVGTEDAGMANKGPFCRGGNTGLEYPGLEVHR